MYTILLAYLIGSIPAAIIIGKIFFDIDIRKHGSFNPGATNSIRVLGKKAGLAVLIFDIGKGALAAALPILLSQDIDPIYTGLAAVIGHCFPVFAGFRGGKAIATTAGMLIIANPVMFFVVYLTFIAVIWITKYVFFGSISVGITILLYALFDASLEHELIFIFYLLLLIYLHRSNIINFFNQTEPKINDKTVKKDRIGPKKIS